MTAKFTNPLDSIKVASPCSADWDAMVGNNRQRHCGDCKLDVYNLSGMTKREAENLIMNAEGRVCARFYRRADGTVITKDCPVGWAALKKRMSRIWTAAASVIVTVISGIGITSFVDKSTELDLMGEIRIENPSYIQTNPEPEVGQIIIEPSENPVEIKGQIKNVEPNRNKAVIGKMVISPK